MKLNNKKIKADNIVLNELERLSKIENDDLFASELNKFIEKSKTNEFYDGQDEINLEAEGLPNVVMYDEGRKFKYVNGKIINIKKEVNREYITACYNGKRHEMTVSILKHKYYGDFEGWVNLKCINYPNYDCNPEKGLIRNAKNGEILGILKDSPYARVLLCNEYGKKVYSVHRIVAHLVYGIDLYDENIDVNHKNENKLDNRACNLIPHTRKQNRIWSTVNKTGYTNIHQCKNGKYYYFISKCGFIIEEEAYEWRCWAMPIAGIEDLKEGFREPINRDVLWMSLDFLGFPNYVINQKGKILNLTKCSIDNHSEKDYIKGSIKKDKYGKKYHIIHLTNSKGISKILRLHILLAKCFIFNPDPEKYIKVDHDDNNGLNNNLENLSWTINRHNITKDKKRKGKYPNVRKGKRGNFFVVFNSNLFNTPEEAQEDMKRVFKLLGLEYVDRNELRANEEIPE